MATLDIQLKNTTTTSQVYASITGQALDRDNALFLLTADGRTPYYPAQPANDQTPPEQNVAIALGNPGSTVTVTVPHLAGSRIYFSIGKPLTFLLNRGGNGAALVAPSIANPSDPNYNIQWGFCEFTFNTSQLFCNITYVDFVGLPISLSLTEQSGNTQNVTGFSANGLDTIANDLRSQAASDHQPWDSLIFAPNGQILRILSPNSANIGKGSLFAGYFEPYVDQVWSKYQSDTLSIDTQNGDWGTVRGNVNQNSLLTFANPNGQPYTFAKPSTADIFSCSSGPFNLPNNEYGNLGARLAAGLNRSTMLISDVQPGASPAYYYQSSPTNHYSRIVHAVNNDHLGYAFPYDDVTPSGGQDQSGKVASGSIRSFTVTVGGGQQTNEKAEL
ncbi:MAG: hypothetical protein LQ338_003371 [Usnochroma carphineum]|nr:MAG: hypothetical protein LQ338_003371 [Usnochroma carphineum]